MDNTEEKSIDHFVEVTKKFLKEDVECHFNWELEKFDTNFNVLERLEAKLKDKDLIIETPLVQKWALKLSYGYEVFKGNKKSGVEIVREAVDEMESTEDDLFVKYKTAFQHLACSLLATMLLETYSPTLLTDQLYNLLLKVNKMDNMSNSEKSGVLGLKAHVLRWYGPDGTKAAIPVITEASCLCPEEFEWKISRVIILTRMRHFNRGQSLSWADVALAMEILEELAKSKDVIGDQEVVCKYFLAVTHKDLIVMQRADQEQEEKSSAELKRLYMEIYRSKTTSPQIVSFVAQQLARDGQLELGISIIQRALEVLPRHIGLNTTISILYKRSREFHKVLYHSEIAMDEGGYGAAWIFLECATKMKIHIHFEDFFGKMLNQQTYSFKVQTHVQAALFYYFSRNNILRGSDHIKSALEADPTYDGLSDFFCFWVKQRINPLEIAYNQIHIYLSRKQPSYRYRRILQEVQETICNHTDVTNFVTSKDMVNDLKENFQQYHRKKSKSSSADCEEKSG